MRALRPPGCMSSIGELLACVLVRVIDHGRCRNETFGIRSTIYVRFPVISLFSSVRYIRLSRLGLYTVSTSNHEWSAYNAE
jgi:hypothetical protein